MTDKKKILKICYYDNVCGGRNKCKDLHRFVECLLDWVDSHDAFLVIKTKTYRYRWTWLMKTKLRIRKFLMTFIHPLVKGDYELLNVKNLYGYYPHNIKRKFSDLIKKNKLIFSFTRSDVVPGILSDIAIVVPAAHIVQLLKPWNELMDIVYFDWNVVSPDSVKEVLDKKYTEK